MSKHNDQLVDAHNGEIEQLRVVHVSDARGGYWKLERNAGRHGWECVAIGTTEVEVRDVLARLTCTEPSDDAHADYRNDPVFISNLNRYAIRNGKPQRYCACTSCGRLLRNSATGVCAACVTLAPNQPHGDDNPLGETLDSELEDLPELGVEYDAWLDAQNDEFIARHDAGMLSRF